MIVVKHQADSPGLAGFEGHAFEVHKLEEWPLYHRAGTMDINLDDFIAIAMAGVGYLARNPYHAAPLERLTAKLKVFVLESGIAQPMAEWI